MKTSKIIFTTYFSLFGLILLSFLVFGFIYKDKNPHEFSSSNIIHKSIPINNIKYIKVNKDCKISIEKDTCQKIEYYYEREAVFNEPKYLIQNDTLVINSTDISNSSKSITIKGNNFLYLNGNDCEIKLYGLNQEKLTVDGRNSKIEFRNDLNIDSLKLSLSNSSFDGWNYKINHLNIQLNKSTLSGRNDIPLKSLTGNVINNSKITIQTAFHYNLNIDESCSVERY